MCGLDSLSSESDGDASAFLVGPEMPTGFSVDELRIHAHALSRLASAPFKHYRTPSSRPIHFTSIGLPLKVKAVLHAITNDSGSRDNSVVRSSVRPSTK
jgi:hypothetical protein